MAPESPAMWHLWRTRARHNTGAYETVFRQPPIDRLDTYKSLADYRNGGRPLTDRPTLCDETLEDVEGILVEYPVNFLKNEDTYPNWKLKVEGVLPTDTFT